MIQTTSDLIALLKKLRTTRKAVVTEGEIRKRIAESEGTPLIEGDIAHFFYEYDGEEDVSVVGDWNKWKQGADTMKPLRPHSTLYHLEKHFPIDARFSYRLSIGGGGFFNDPYNPHSMQEVFGNNTYFRMPAKRAIPYFEEPSHDTHRGRIIELVVKGNRTIKARTVTMYIPYGHRLRGAQRFLYVNDGAEAITVGKFINVLDNLYHAEPNTPKVIVVFVPPVDRHEEYSLNPSFAKWFSTSLVSQVETRLKVTSKPNLRTIQGASLGGLFSLYLGMKHHNTFGNVAAQSSSLWMNNQWLIAEYTRRKQLPLRIYLHTGTIHDALDTTRNLLTVLQQKGYDAIYRESNESHNWANWSARYADIVRWLSNGNLPNR